VLLFPPISPPAVKEKLVDASALTCDVIRFATNNGIDSIIIRIKKKKYFFVCFARNEKNFKLPGNGFLLFVLVRYEALMFTLLPTNVVTSYAVCSLSNQ